VIRHIEISDVELRKQIRKGQIRYGANSKLKIFGKLDCNSGKGMKKENRLFFNSSSEAIQFGFRPCGHCMRKEWLDWKKGN